LFQKKYRSEEISLKATGNIKFYQTRGRLCCKISGNEGEYFEGDAIVYETNMMMSSPFPCGEVKPEMCYR
jgi:dihydroxy-acid dehydratase